MSMHRACHDCGLIHYVPALGQGERATCKRCGATIARAQGGKLAASRTAALSLGALVLFWPAILLPLFEVERLGQRHTSSLLFGTIELLLHDNWFVGGIVLLFSIVFPLFKLLVLLELSLLQLLHQRHKALTYRLMAHTGKWSMMDVMLLAFLVMLMKLGSLVEFRFGPAVLAFILCVALSMMASMIFDPHSIWEDDA